MKTLQDSKQCGLQQMRRKDWREDRRVVRLLLLGTGRGSPTPQKRVFLGIAQIAILPPLLRKSGHFVAQFFCRKGENSLNRSFDFGNEYFDIDY